MPPEATAESVVADSTANEVIETTEANTESQPTDDGTESTLVSQETASESELRKSFEKATGKKWNDKEGQPDDDEPEAKETAKTEAKSEPVKPELSEKSKKYLTDLGISENDALAKAITAFERQKFDEEEIERRLSKGESKFIEDGLVLAQQQKQVDSLFGRIGQLEKKPASQEKEEVESQDIKEPKNIPADVKAEIDKVLETLANDELFKDAVPALGMMATTLSNHYEAKLQSQKSEVESMRQQFQAEVEKLQYLRVETSLEKARASLLGDKYPQLKDKAVHDKVLEMYDTFAASNRYNDKTPEQVYTEAAEMVLGKDEAKSFAEALIQKHLNRKKSQPTLPTNKAPSVAAMSEDEKQRLVFNKIKRQSRDRGE